MQNARADRDKGAFGPVCEIQGLLEWQPQIKRMRMGAEGAIVESLVRFGSFRRRFF